MARSLSNAASIFATIIFTLISESCGMFEFILTQLDVMDKDSPYSNFNNIKIIRFNRTTFVINGSFELFVDSIDDFESSCNVYKKMGNEYKLTPYKNGPDKICNALKKDELFYPAILSKTENFPPAGTCDFTKGKIYKVINYLPDLEKVPPVFQSGDYMIECNITKGENFIQGFKVFGQVFNIAGGSALKG